MHILENSSLRITIADRGAELTGVLDKAAGLERIWTADPAVWNRHAPILFPFVGKVYGGTYRTGGREYDMKTQHGFARDLPFQCVEETEGSVTHSLADTGQTRAIYPYAFCLRVTHALDRENERLLHIRWEVENRGADTMLYSIGGHPGFLLPPGVKKEDCFLMLQGCDAPCYFSVNAEGFALPEQKRALRPEGGLVKYAADIPDTWIFGNRQIKAAGIALPDSAPFVTLRCDEFPLLAVWANPKGSFICLEPWFGRTDDAGFSGTLEEKPGIERLSPGETRRISYSILFHPTEG